MFAVLELKGEWTLRRAQEMFNDIETSVRFIADDYEEIEDSTYDTGNPDNLALEFEDCRWPGQQLRWRAAPVVDGEWFAGNEWQEFYPRAKGQVMQALQMIHQMKGMQFSHYSDAEEGHPDGAFILVFKQPHIDPDTGLTEMRRTQVVVEPLGEGEPLHKH